MARPKITRRQEALAVGDLVEVIGRPVDQYGDVLRDSDCEFAGRRGIVVPSEPGGAAGTISVHFGSEEFPIWIWNLGLLKKR